MKLNDMHETLDRDLQDPEYAALYLNDALRDGSPEEFILALRNIIRANRQTEQSALETELGGESIDREILNLENPHFSTVYRIVSSLGFQLSVAPPISSSL